MEKTQRIVIKNKNGLHTRVAAMVARQSQKIEKIWDCQLYLRRTDSLEGVPCNSVLPLVSLKVKKGELVEVYSRDLGSDEAVFKLASFIKQTAELEVPETEVIDSILQENTLASEKIFESINNGLIAMDSNGIINIFNRAAEEITGIKAKDIIGKKGDEWVPNFNLNDLLNSKRENLGLKHKIGKKWVITNKSPIVVDEEVVGGVVVFQDISQIEELSWELHSVKELKEKLNNILETVDDGICMINHCREITYVNHPFIKMFKKAGTQVLTRKIQDLFPDEKLGDSFFLGKGECIMTTKDGREFIMNARPIIIESKFSGNVVVAKELTEIAKLADRIELLSQKTQFLQEELAKKEGLNQSFGNIVGKSGALIESLTVASKAARTDAAVLIRGESGTGKEMVARAIHLAGSRSNKPFVGMNCAAIPSNLLESELFGYEKGAFTGAYKEKRGKFEIASGGSIFLDEIGDMDKAMQAKLLRVLQEQEIERIGSIKPIKIDVRVIAATNSPLEEMMKEGTFRRDLYYRLNVITVLLPPLRQRKGDIPLLVEHFTKKISKKYDLPNCKIKKSALTALEQYHFPGNVRELENMIEGGMTLSNSDWITLDDLPGYLCDESGNVKPLTNTFSLDGDNLPTFEEMERELIDRAIKKHGSFRKAGVALGLDHKTIATKVRKYNLQ
ncbi:sigma 54-interacting transcriptional regulator [Acetobacterium woodii]|uniref:HTH-type transcriptional regulatory protein TyrR n=1 Tax=Acetobacterium woodii (strain ATCC 29683 / DSM 1030 / JCM 2381 / KCTC 1655 / WB1) TaxID=931626 RepID=H6LBU7_ACEWD|nr:sigma 54-interacting transcriptional regulator [Acetobacterium woodii]AFA47690.1 sensory box sigma-54 dependent transcriptional regulator [Acetobacterium woodii DSM 1030]